MKKHHLAPLKERLVGPITNARNYLGHGNNSLLRKVNRRNIHELKIHLGRMRQPRRAPRIVILPSHGPEFGSSNLRAIELGKALRKIGWRVTTIPYNFTLKQRQRILKLEKPDIILIQKQRHPLNRPSLYPGIPTVFDIDDADYVDSNHLDAVIECCRDSRAVIAGSRMVADWCRQYNPNVSIVWSATPKLPLANPPLAHSKRRPIVTWASSEPAKYLGEADLVRDLMLRLSSRIPFEFWLYGVDDESPGSPIDAMLEPMRRAGITVKTYSYMKYEDFLDSLGHVAVGLQPVDDTSRFSTGKSFGKVLAYLVAEVPIVASDALDHRDFFENGENGFIARDLDDWCAAVELLLKDPAKREAIAARACHDYEKHLSITAAASKADQFLRTLL